MLSAAGARFFVDSLFALFDLVGQAAAPDVGGFRYFTRRSKLSILHCRESGEPVSF
jgi:hypothetical protein